MQEDVIDLVQRFLAVARDLTQDQNRATASLNLTLEAAQALRGLSEEQAALLAASGTFIFRVKLDSEAHESPSPELASIVHDYLFVVRELVRSRPHTAHIILGISAGEAKRMACMGLAEIREATEHGRWRIVLPSNFAKLVRVFFNLGTVPQRRSFMLLQAVGRSS